MDQIRKVLTVVLLAASIPGWIFAGFEAAMIILALAYFAANWTNFFR
ncbi:MAG TPA: hypothetical protein VK249_18120 [Anaerolineales bacterium]|nr:hypothetical protein [Anaerolineales bacterium]